MLETVLEIGRKVRNSPDGLRNHRYVKSAPVFDAKKNPVKFWIVSVQKDGSFDFSTINPLVDENHQKRLFYLNYKSSDADSTKPYVFGDLYRSVTKLGEDGNFRFGDLEKKSWMAKNSFERGDGLGALETPVASRFRQSFREQMIAIEAFIRDNTNCYIHFDFAGQCWHEMEELNQLNKKLLSTFFGKVDGGYILKAFLYKTMSSGNSRLPEFSEDTSRLWLFKDESQALDLLYGINYASKAAVRGGEIKIVVLPRGEHLTAQQIERFFGRVTDSEPNIEYEESEDSLVADNKQSDSDDPDGDELFSFLPSDKSAQDFVQFDFIFSKSGGTQSDVDMIEFAGIERSKLAETSQRIRGVRMRIEAQRRVVFANAKKPLLPLRVMQSFRNILGDPTRDQKKYQNHLLSVLPRIYTDTYFDDPVLLPGLIQKTEFNIRNEQANFAWLKFDFYFLIGIQNRPGEDRLMNIQSSKSYRVGFLLGKLAKQFSGPDTPIKSFEKNYVGLLSRRIGSLSDVVHLANDINQKLIMHEKSNFTFRVSTQLAQTVREFDGAYDKNECAFGFFESYFAPLPPKGGSGNTEFGGESTGGADDASADEKEN